VARLLVGGISAGTFTDCVVLDRTGRITATKASSTREISPRGCSPRCASPPSDSALVRGICREVEVLTHGTTVGTNALIQRKGAKVGLITRPGTRTRSTSCAARAACLRDIAK